MDSTRKYFVLPYVDELFYSIIARYQDHVGISWYRLSLTHFGKQFQESTQISILPQGIDYFVEKIGKFYSLTKETIIDHHSNNKAYDYCTERQSIQPEKPIYFSSTKIPRIKFFQYCPECFESQNRIGEEVFWNRLHNIEDIKLCIEHNILLERWTPPAHELNKRKFFKASDVSTSSPRKNFSKTLFDTTYKTISGLDLKSNRSKLLDSAIAKKILNKRGRRIELDKNHFEALMKYIGILVNGDADAIRVFNKIRKYLSARKTPITIYHYYILESYVDSIQSEEPKIYRLTNSECINRICPFFNKNTHTHSHVLKYTYKNPIGIITNCKKCGYEYFKNFDIKKPTSVRDYGTLISDYIKKWPSISFTQMSKVLGICHGTLRNIYNTGNTKRSYYEGRIVLTERKKIWLQEISSPTFISIGSSALKYKTIYRYLKIFDPEWLKNVNVKYRKKKRPSIKKLTAPKSEDEIILDIKAFKSSQLAMQIPRRVTKTLILGQKNFMYLTRDLIKLLPKVEMFLKFQCESKFDFKKRKLLMYLGKNATNLPSYHFTLSRFKLKQLNNASSTENDELISIVNSFFKSQIAA